MHAEDCKRPPPTWLSPRYSTNSKSCFPPPWCEQQAEKKRLSSQLPKDKHTPFHLRGLRRFASTVFGVGAATEDDRLRARFRPRQLINEHRHTPSLAAVNVNRHCQHPKLSGSRLPEQNVTVGRRQVTPLTYYLCPLPPIVAFEAVHLLEAPF